MQNREWCSDQFLAHVHYFLALFLMSCMLFSAAGPHTTINGKEVVNFASANYLGLIGHEKLLVRSAGYSITCFLFCIHEFLLK